MKTSIPWQVRGIRAEARETAREAARRAGMSVGEWLNTVIVEFAIDDGVLPEDIESFSDDSDLAAINRRLDRLTRQLETVISGKPSDPASELPGRPGPPSLPKDAASMDDAIAEIAARQRALEAEFVASPSITPPQAETPRPRVETPMPDISGLERQLQHITQQIELFNRPSGLEGEVGSLRQELNAIGRTLTEAMPKRAVEALENELRAVAQRLDQTRQCGFDPKSITAIERGLIEVRDALRTLTPAEKLVGYGDAIDALSRKIDQMPAKQDPAAVRQLESAIGAMRNAVAHVASNEALTLLAQEVRALSARIDRIDTPSGPGLGSEAISSLDQRIGALSEQLNKNASVASTLPPQFEAMLKRYSDRFDQAQATPRGDVVAVNHLEDRIVNLVQKLDASDARLGTLAGIERGLSDLLVRIDELRSEKPVPANEPVIPPVVDAIQRDMARTKNTLEDVHGTLGHVVDRLATIEADIRRPAPAAVPAPATPAPARAASPQVERKPVESALPPDYPLEPGSGAPRSGIPVTPAERIAASEAVLAPARAAAAAAAPQTSQPNFIAAARRAAQAASSGVPATDKIAAAGQSADSVPGTGQLSKRLRSLFVGASVIVIVLGGLRIATNLLDQSNEAKIEGPATLDSPPPSNSEAIPAPKKPATQSSVVPDNKSVTPVPALATSPEPEKLPVPSFDGVTPRAATPDVTGALPRSVTSFPPSLPAAPVPAAPAPVSGPDRLPSALRAAAAAGDPTAAYEMGVRYFDGRGVIANVEEAARWLEKAAKAELAPAQFRLGSLYEKGQGVKKDIEAARKLYLAASDKGNAKAMHNLAVLYAEGIEGKPDYRSAAVWFRKGADHGITDSQYNLGILYARGIGVDRNIAESFKWFSLAAVGGDKESIRKRDEVASRLDPQSLTAARQAAEAWTAQPQPDEAINVKAPAGGWDQADAAPPKKSRTAAPSRTGLQ